MKEVFVDDLCGTEVLAVPVITDANVVLIQSETVLKQEYIEKLKEHSKEIDDLYEYRKGTDKIRDAFRILEENHLNIFRDR